MRQFFLFLLLFFPVVALGYSCPPTLESSKSAQAVHSWLSRFVDVKELHGCVLDIRVCESGATVEDDAPIGEILVVTLDGREGYLSVDFPLADSWRFRTKVKNYSKAIYYRKKDRYYEEVEGRTEVWQLELRTLWDDPNVLDHLDLGIYSTHSQLNQDNGNDSHWFNCAAPKSTGN